MYRDVRFALTPLSRINFEKEAGIPTWALRGGRLAGSALSHLFSPKQPYKTLSPIISKVENALVPKAGLGRTLLRGAFHNAGREAVNNALIGGVLSGGLNAAFAPEGQSRSEAFMQGAGSGALSGLGYGLLSGAGSQVARNAGRAHLGSLAKNWTAKGVPLTRPEVANIGKHMGWRDALKKSVGSEDLPSRAIARNKLLTGAGTFAGDMVLPTLAMSALESTPEAPKQPDLQPNAPAVYHQPQYFKTSAAKTGLRAIDLTKLPSYHK